MLELNCGWASNFWLEISCWVLKATDKDGKTALMGDIMLDEKSLIQACEATRLSPLDATTPGKNTLYFLAQFSKTEMNHVHQEKQQLIIQLNFCEKKI